MRNTEQVLKSVGLLAYEIGSLPECNAKLSDYGPSNFKENRITVKLRPGQQTAPGRNNVSFASCSGYSKIIISIILICLLGYKKISILPNSTRFLHLCAKHFYFNCFQCQKLNQKRLYHYGKMGVRLNLCQKS